MGRIKTGQNLHIDPKTKKVVYNVQKLINNGATYIWIKREPLLYDVIEYR